MCAVWCTSPIPVQRGEFTSPVLLLCCSPLPSYSLCLRPPSAPMSRPSFALLLLSAAALVAADSVGYSQRPNLCQSQNKHSSDSCLATNRLKHTRSYVIACRYIIRFPWTHAFISMFGSPSVVAYRGARAILLSHAHTSRTLESERHTHSESRACIAQLSSNMRTR